MSDDLVKVSEGTVVSLEKNDGAIVFREDGVEMLLPDINQDLPLPKHLVPLMALAMILGNEPKLQAAIDDMYKFMDEKHPNT